VFGFITPSAIPMWEYLSKDEKMSYLYSMFANQVEEFCDTVDMNNCNQELLKYGLNKLKEMPEDHLDTMDPYQRGANTLIWDSMMEGHQMMAKNKPARRITTTARPKPNSYDDQSFTQEYQGQASAKIDNVYRVPPPRNFFYTHPQYTVPIGPSQYTLSSGPSQYHRRWDTQRPIQINRDSYDSPNSYSTTYLTGPMVVRVYPDGTPVQEQQALPQDEDLKQYKMSKVKLPSF